MQLPLSDAKRCIHLLDRLDVFALETSNLFKRGDTVIVEDINEIRVKIRNYWQHNDSFIERFISSTKNLSHSDIELLRSWKNKTRSQFLIVKYYTKYAVFYSDKDKNNYGVLALIDSFSALLPHNPPIMIETSLLPYGEHIIWDGLINVYGISFDRSIAASFTQECIKAKKAGTIVFQL